MTTLAENTKLAIYRANLFKRSETFITSQAQYLQSYNPLFIGLKTATRPDNYNYRIIKQTNLDKFAMGAFRPNSAIIECFEQRKIELVHAHFGPDGTQVAPTCKKLGIP